MTIIDGMTDTVVLGQSGACLSIHAASTPPDSRLGAMVRPEPGRVAVVVDGPANAVLDALDSRLLADLHGRLPATAGGARSGVRLLVGAAARSGPDGSAPLAARLADALGVEVVAPDGPLVVLRRGELFSAGPASAWWEFAPGRSPEPVGPRCPAPVWQRDLPARLGSRPGDQQVTVTPVPAGIWVRAAGGPPADLSDPAFAVPPAPERVAVLAGRPGEARPPVGALAEVVRALPHRSRQSYVLVPYGPEPAGSAPIAQRLAAELGAGVRATHGLPSYAPDGSLDFPAVDRDGCSTWRPFVTESVYHPGARSPTPTAWSAALAGLPAAGPAAYRLADGWLVEMVPCGLLVGPATAGPDPLVRCRPTHPDRVDLVVDAPGRAPGNVPLPVLDAIGRLARALPPDTRDRLRMLVTDRGDPAELVGLAGALGLPIRRLGRDGTAGAIPPAELPPGRPAPAVPPVPAGLLAPGMSAEPPVPAGAGAPAAATVAPAPGVPAAPAASEAVAGPVVLTAVTPDGAGAADQWWRRGSTAQERQRFRLSLGWRYDAASRYVTRMLAERPSLRSLAAGDDGLATELAAVHVFASSDQTERMESLRTGATRAVDRPFLSCVVGGLRRLPTLVGPVLRGGPDDPGAAATYVPGRDVVEMGLLLAAADAHSRLPGRIEVLIWSSTGRRLDGLVDAAEGAQVVFVPGTVFRVLDAERTGEPHRVYLAEIAPDQIGRADAAREERILGRLRAFAQARLGERPDAGNAGDAGQPAVPRTGPSYAVLPGLVPAQSLRGVA